MKRLSVLGFVALIVIAVVMGFSGIGCDTVTNSSNVITIEPALLTVTGAYAIAITIADTNTSLFLPLEWSVSDTRLGTITGQGGLTALYEGGTGVGVNTITVKDQGNAEGFAVVNHVPADGIELSPKTNSISGAGTLMTFSVTPDPSLVLPLVWSSRNQALGFFVSETSYEAVYQTTGARGDNIVTVSDQLGASAGAIVYHR